MAHRVISLSGGIWSLSVLAFRSSEAVACPRRKEVIGKMLNNFRANNRETQAPF